MQTQTQTMSPVMMPMPTTAAPRTATKMFMDIPTAAELAGFSLRHFRRIMEEDRIPVVEIGRKFFILSRDFNNWETARRNRGN